MFKLIKGQKIKLMTKLKGFRVMNLKLGKEDYQEPEEPKPQKFTDKTVIKLERTDYIKPPRYRRGKGQ